MRDRHDLKVGRITVALFVRSCVLGSLWNLHGLFEILKINRWNFLEWQSRHELEVDFKIWPLFASGKSFVLSSVPICVVKVAARWKKVTFRIATLHLQVLNSETTNLRGQHCLHNLTLLQTYRPDSLVMQVDFVLFKKLEQRIGLKDKTCKLTRLLMLVKSISLPRLIPR